MRAPFPDPKPERKLPEMNNKKKFVASLATCGLVAGALLGIAAPALANEGEIVDPTVVVVEEAAALVEEAPAAENIVIVEDPAPIVLPDPIVEAPAPEADVSAISAKTAAPEVTEEVEEEDKVCDLLSTGHKFPGAVEEYVYTAPAGQLITGYCVKSGSVQTGGGPVYVPVNPPASEITIFYPSDKPKDISHFSVSLSGTATASLSFTAPGCFAPGGIDLAGSSITNATWGPDTDLSALGYSITATANSGFIFADGTSTKTFTGTLSGPLAPTDPECDGEQGLVATATLAFDNADCFGPESIDFDNSTITNATWGDDTDASPLGFTIVATAVPSAEFLDGDLGDPSKKTFTGTLAPALDPDSYDCDLTTLDMVLPKVTSTQATCVANASYTLSAADGYSSANVTFTVNGTPGVAAGTYKVNAPSVITITAQPVAPHGLEESWSDPAPIAFAAAPAACDLETLALTGTNASTGLGIAGGMLVAGIIALYARRRLTLSAE